VDLAGLGAGGFRIDGAAASDNAGQSVAGAGDVNGDGVDDVVVGAHVTDNNNRLGSGSAYVLFGPLAPGTIDLAQLGAAGARIDGAAIGNRAGWSVAGTADVNGDGVADLIVGAPFATNNGRAFSGSAYVVFGPLSPGTIDLAQLGAAGVRIDGAAAGDYAGYSVAGAGDVNGDGLSDVLVGAYLAANNDRAKSGSAYAVFGRTLPGSVDLADLGSEGVRIDGAAADDHAGAAVSSAGDVNGDRLDDVLVGADLADNNGRNLSGSAYVLFGPLSPGTVDLAQLGAAGARIDGAAAGDQAGWSVARAGDVAGNGVDDVVVGAKLADNNGRNLSGSAYVLEGAGADLRVVKVAAPEVVAPGEAVEFAVEVINDGPGDAAGVVLEDTLPARMVLQAVEPSQGSCEQAATGQVRCELGRVRADGVALVVIRAVVDAAASGAQVNGAQVSSTSVDPSLDNNAAEATVTVQGASPAPAPDTDADDSKLVVRKRADRSVVYVGEPVNYTVDVRNAGQRTTGEIMLVDGLSSLAGVARVRVSDGRCNRRRPVVCRLGPLGPGEGTTVRARVVPRRAGRLISAVAAIGDQIVVREPAEQVGSTVPDLDRVAVLVRARRARLGLRMTPRPRRVQPGHTVRYRLRVAARRDNARELRVCARPPGAMRLTRARGGRIRAGRACWSAPKLLQGRHRSYRMRARVKPLFSGRRLTAKATARAAMAPAARARATVTVELEQPPPPPDQCRATWDARVSPRRC
jgi:uncharacterized repeat protein (TIGR01451 family)